MLHPTHELEPPANPARFKPLSNLDAELRVATRGEISALHKRLGNTMIYVTHDQVEAMTMADKIAVLRDGCVEQFGKPLDLYNAPTNRFVAGFIGSPKMNFIKGELVAGASANTIGFKAANAPVVDLNAADFDATAAPGAAVELGIRPNHLSLAGEGLPFDVQSVEHLGGETYAYGVIAGTANATLHLQGQVDMKPGTRLYCAVDAAAAHLFRGDGTSLRSGIVECKF